MAKLAKKLTFHSPRFKYVIDSTAFQLREWAASFRDCLESPKGEARL